MHVCPDSPIRLLISALLLAAISATAKPDLLRALLVTGGCCHDYKNQKVIIPENLKKHGLNFEWTISHEGTGRDTKNSVYKKPNWIDGFDLVVHNECYGGVTDVEFINGIAKAHGDSGVPALVIHCSLHSYRNAKTDEWRKFLGVTSVRHEKHRPVEVKPIKTDHPAMKDFPESWKTPNGELYIITKEWENTIPLAKAYGVQTKKDHVVIWANTYGKAKVFGTSLGHHNETMQDPVYAQFLANGAKWAMSKAVVDPRPEVPKPQKGNAAPSTTPTSDYAAKGYLTYDTSPMGSAEWPLILRTFVRNPNLDRATVLPNHSVGLPSPKYTHRSGRESNSKYGTLNGIPAAIAVNAGNQLSYAWDTTECRLLYSWANGFLDMSNYWGDRKSGRRKGFGYTPYLKGFLFYKAQGKHPISINGKSVAEFGAPKYVGYSVGKDGHPTFDFKAGSHELSVAVRPGKVAQTFTMAITEKSGAKLSFSSPNTPTETVSDKPGALTILVRPNAGEQHHGAKAGELKIAKPTAEIGETLFTTNGCIACHTVDGGHNHGPTLKGVFGAKREILEGGSITVDEAYLKESIVNPHARTVKGYPKGMMPPYVLKDAEIQSLILYVKGLK
jgi:type 1 glutamine amidotransferase/cytochrome c2